ncbi:3',5'-cyclic-AMP phosphodiesterase [Calothrix sp. PCC 6303]|uniref:3',5'-cyclic-AMP phosphodiesterase n=1 Tax=Calothrix sp. PCC 6303 TaxID=1170562 RepID=UPI0002A01B4A|nr:3',5'-cyclic-AMP phosphodiesterase [Calothrix sp. PCC 6303]AFZ00768.1 Calcineurin phosphoesterase domain protein [Calothrix sp. PCC 6303]
MKQVFPLSIAQITDIHLFANEDQKLLGVPTMESLGAVIEYLQMHEQELDLLLLTGDLSGDGESESYENLRNLLSPLQIPTYCLPGNHDHAIAMSEFLSFGLISQRKSFERGGWNFILLDSSVPGKVHGHLSQETLFWLDSQLKATKDIPTLIALHHPPFLVNSSWLDSSRLQNPEELFAVLDAYPKVKLVLFGHIHQEFEKHRQGVGYLGTPSTCIQFQPGSQDFTLDPIYPGFRLLKLHGNGTWETSVPRVAFEQTLELTALGY